MDESLSLLLANSSAISVALPFLVGVLRYFRLNTLQQRLFYLVLLSVFFESLAAITANWKGFQPFNLPLLHTFTFIHFTLIVLVFQDHLKTFFQDRLPGVFIAVFGVFVVVNGIWLDGFFAFNPHARGLQSLLVLFIVLSFFYRTLKEMKVTSLETEPLFWASSGLLLYFSGGLFIFIVSNYISTSREVMLTSWGIHAILNIVLNLFLVLALWVRPRA